MNKRKSPRERNKILPKTIEGLFCRVLGFCGQADGALPALEKFANFPFSARRDTTMAFLDDRARRKEFLRQLRRTARAIEHILEPIEGKRRERRQICLTESQPAPKKSVVEKLEMDPAALADAERTLEAIFYRPPERVTLDHITIARRLGVTPDEIVELINRALAIARPYWKWAMMNGSRPPELFSQYLWRIRLLFPPSVATSIDELLEAVADPKKLQPLADPTPSQPLDVVEFATDVRVEETNAHPLTI